MKVSEIAELLVGIGACLTGVASIIQAVKKEPKKPRRPRKFK